MIVRRLLVVGGLAAVFVVTTAGSALADDLTDYLEEARDAIYSGQRLVATSWDGIESVGIFEIQHHGGMASVGSGAGSATMGAGRMYLAWPEDAAVSFVLHAEPELGGRYSVSHGEATKHLGRAATLVEVMEAGSVRVRMVVDDSTSAPVATEVFDGEGELFRYSAMTDFSVWVDPAMAAFDDREYRMMLPLQDADLPIELAGYRLIDVYAAPHDGRQAFYTDGLFSFSVFTTVGRADWASVAKSEHPYTVDGYNYLRVISPTSVTVLWNAPTTAIALVGDLPPDHLGEVLGELPLPGTDNWMKRMWRKLFGY
ncbi:MAG: hypothetical protein WBO25_01285 [Acidimicrobiia bacterium]